MKAKYFIVKVGSKEDTKIIENKLKNALDKLSYPLSVQDLGIDLDFIQYCIWAHGTMEVEYFGRFKEQKEAEDRIRQIKFEMFPKDEQEVD